MEMPRNTHIYHWGELWCGGSCKHSMFFTNPWWAETSTLIGTRCGRPLFVDNVIPTHENSNANAKDPLRIQFGTWTNPSILDFPTLFVLIFILFAYLGIIIDIIFSEWYYFRLMNGLSVDRWQKDTTLVSLPRWRPTGWSAAALRDEVAICCGGAGWLKLRDGEKV